MPNPQLLYDKQCFIDYLNKIVSLIEYVKEDIIIQRKNVNLMNSGEDRDEMLFWLNSIEDAANSLGSSLEKYDKCDIVKAITCLVYQLFFTNESYKVSIDSLIDIHTRMRG